MAAPTPTARGTPAGIPLPDGHSTLITFANNPTIKFWEKSVTPPGMDGGDAVETHTMHNDTWRTVAPRTLQTMTESSTSVAYDPATYDEIIALVNVEDIITLTFSDGSQLTFFGYLKTFEPDEAVEGTQPTATITIQPTNEDSVTPFGEEGPIMYGPELIVNGDFATGDLTGWDDEDAGAAESTYDAGTMKLVTDGSDAARRSNSAAITGLTIGQTYVLSGTVVGDGVEVVQLSGGGGNVTWSAGSNSDSWVADATEIAATELKFGNFAPNQTTNIDNISLKRKTAS